MRVLFVGQPALGHLLPMLPLADALIAAGDDVTFVTGADICATLTGRGYHTVAAGVSAAEQRAFAEAHRPAIRDPLDGMRFAYGTMFTAHHARLMLPELLAVIDRIRPDLLVHESAEFATALAGTLRGIPWVHHSYALARPREVQQLAAEAMSALWHEHALAMPATAGMFTHAYLDVPAEPAASATRARAPRHPASPGGGASQPYSRHE
jgi:UDP:flavonoid glycosyltransferase YjiC (YdhE family)